MKDGEREKIQGVRAGAEAGTGLKQVLDVLLFWAEQWKWNHPAGSTLVSEFICTTDGRPC